MPICDINPLEWSDIVADLSEIFNELDIDDDIVDISNVFDESTETLFPDLKTDPHPDQYQSTSHDDKQVCEESCPICFEILESDKNVAITNCKHRFCSQCIFKHVSQNNSCPFCREKLYMTLHDDDDDDDDTDDEITLGDDEDDEDEYDDDDEDQYTDDEDNEGLENIDAIIENLKTKYNYKDLVVLLLQRYNNDDAKYTQQKVDKMGDDFWDVIYSIDAEPIREEGERNQMATEDRVDIKM